MIHSLVVPFVGLVSDGHVVRPVVDPLPHPVDLLATLQQCRVVEAALEGHVLPLAHVGHILPGTGPRRAQPCGDESTDG